MRKKQLLLTTAFVASASIAFADGDVVKNGITYSVISTTIENQGNITSSPSNEQTITTFDNGVSVNIVKIQTISGQKRNVSLKAIDIDNTNVVPGQIISWSEDAPQPEDGIKKDYNTNINQFGTVPDGIEEFTYEVRTDDPTYILYADACEKAMAAGYDIIKGVNIPSGTWDTQDMDVHPDLYYKMKKSGRPAKTTYEVITHTTGRYSETTQYLNGCVDTFYPTTIDAKIGYKVSEGKNGVVTGVVNHARMEDIIEGNARNFDFTGAIIFGEVNQTVPANKLVYFPANTKLKETSSKVNIVVGSQCADYQIEDNGEEIYVNKSFSATESSYKRTFTHDTYGTIVLPYTVSSTSNIFVKQAKLTSYIASENKLSFTSTEVIAPNTPYMFKVLPTIGSNEEVVIYGDVNTTVLKTADAKSVKFDGAQFVGTFEGLSEEEAAQVYVVGAVGKIGRTTKALKPGRCYLTREISSNAKVENATIEIIDEDGSSEIVKVDETVTAIDGVVNGEVVSVQYISANGQVSNEPFSGINLVKKTFADGSVETSKVAF